MNHLFITTGDPDGVGLEVSSKALASLGPRPGFHHLLFVDRNGSKKELERLKKRFKIQICYSAEEVLDSKVSSTTLSVVMNGESPPRWVEASARACFNRIDRALVTAPMSKQLIQDCGSRDLGHTDILRRVCGGKKAWMLFLGNRFNVFLLSGHLPTTHIEKVLTPGLLESGLKAAARFFDGDRKPLGVLGLNPHAGDNKLIGHFDDELMIPILRKLNRSSADLNLEGPLVPDSAFLKKNWGKYSCFVACYHDQGLIPFKMIHGFASGSHVTVGLPLIRTSVDHGVAKDIFGKNRAQHGSMKDALLTAYSLIRKGKI